MTTEAPPMATLSEMIVEKLKGSPYPLTVKEASKGVPKLKKEKPAELEARVRAVLEEEVASARLFRHPSGKKGDARYWAKDERVLLREQALELAVKPQALSALTKAAGKPAKADAGFVEGVLRDLIDGAVLHQHDGGKKGPLFAATPPTPLLERPANAKALASLAVSMEKLMKKTGVEADMLLAALRKHFTAAAFAPSPPPVAPPIQPAAVVPFTPVSQPTEPVAHPPTPPVSPPTHADELAGRILAALERQGVMSIADLRREMPEEMRGSMFDQAVLRLDDEQRVILHRDADPLGFTEAQRAEFVQDGPSLFTTIGKRG